MTLPDGSTLIASPPNRRRAAELWGLDNKSRPVMIDADDDDDEKTNDNDDLIEIERLKDELRQKMIEVDRERDKARAEREADERDRAAERERDDEMRNAEREQDQIQRERLIHEMQQLRMQREHDAENRKLTARLIEEMDRNRTLEHHVKKEPAAVDDDADFRYSLPMNHADSDVMTDLANCVPLDDKLKQIGPNETARVSTVTDFFNDMNRKQPKLQLILKECNENGSRRFAVNQYRNAFYSVKKPNDITMLVCLMKALHEYGTRMRVKVEA